MKYKKLPLLLVLFTLISSCSFMQDDIKVVKMSSIGKSVFATTENDNAEEKDEDDEPELLTPEMPVRDISNREMSVREMPVSEMPDRELSDREMPVREMSDKEISLPEMPVREMPGN
jgi:hypothetical protein